MDGNLKGVAGGFNEAAALRPQKGLEAIEAIEEVSLASMRLRH